MRPDGYVNRDGENPCAFFVGAEAVIPLFLLAVLKIFGNYTLCIDKGSVRFVKRNPMYSRSFTIVRRIPFEARFDRGLRIAEHMAFSPYFQFWALTPR